MSDIKILKTIFYFVLVGAIIWFLYTVRNILMPFVLSAFFAFLLSPFIGFLESKGLKRTIAVYILFLFFITIFISGIVIFVPRAIDEITSFSKKIPEYTELVKGSIWTLQQQIEKKYPVIKEQGIFDKGLQKAQRVAETELANFPSYILGMFSVISLFVLIPFITFFFLLGGRGAIEKLFRTIPSKYTETTLSIICEIDEILGSFLRGQFLEAFCVGVLSIIGLLIIKVDYAVVIGSIAGLANMIPYLGPVVGAVPAIIIGLIKYQSFDIILKVVIVFSIVQFVDNNFIQPIIFSKGVNLHPVTVIFILMAGAEIAGVMGMFFSIPVACIIKTVFLILIGRKDLV